MSLLILFFVCIDYSCKLISVQSITYFVLKQTNCSPFFWSFFCWAVERLCDFVNLLWWFAETVRAMTHVINQGMAMYWGTSRWSPMEIMVSHFNYPSHTHTSSLTLTSPTSLTYQMSRNWQWALLAGTGATNLPQLAVFYNEPTKCHFWWVTVFMQWKCHVEFISHPKQHESVRTISATYGMFHQLERNPPEATKATLKFMMVFFRKRTLWHGSLTRSPPSASRRSITCSRERRSKCSFLSSFIKSVSVLLTGGTDHTHL